MNVNMLGRKPSPQDDRDYDLADYLDTPDEVVEAPQVEEGDESVAPLVGTDPITEAYNAMLANRSVAPATKAWARVVTEKVVGNSPTPDPTPTPAPTGDVVWNIVPRLNQGETPHCVGFGWADFGNSDPINDSYTNADGDAIYYECKVIDGEPNAEDGSDVRSGAKAMLARKRIAAYAFAKTLDVAETWVKTKGPIVVGTDWTEDMFTPTQGNFVVPTGAVAGGHCYLWSGVEDDVYIFTNSWGADWAMGGQFKMQKADFASLYASNGEACAAVELPI